MRFLKVRFGSGLNDCSLYVNIRFSYIDLFMCKKYSFFMCFGEKVVNEDGLRIMWYYFYYIYLILI